MQIRVRAGTAKDYTHHRQAYADRMMFMVKIAPIEDGEFQTTATSADGKKWRKRYKSWPDATADAVKLRVMLPDMKRVVDGYPLVPYAPETPYEVDVDELIARGFVDT